jgi:hypothetical protein
MIPSQPTTAGIELTSASANNSKQLTDTAANDHNPSLIPVSNSLFKLDQHTIDHSNCTRKATITKTCPNLSLSSHARPFDILAPDGRESICDLV